MARIPVSGRVPISGRVSSSDRFKQVDYINSYLFSSSSITVPIVPATTGFNVAFWFYHNKRKAAERMIDCTDSSGNNGFSINFRPAGGINDRYFELILKNASTVTANPIMEIYPPDWYHIAVTFQPNDLKVYLNGVLIATDTSCSMSTPGGTLTLGKASASATPNYFTSSMKDFLFQNGSAWNSTTITNLFKKRLIPTPDVHYNFVGASELDTTIIDQTGNGNDGAFTSTSGKFTYNVPKPTRTPRNFSLYGNYSSGYDIFIIAGQSNAAGKGSSLNVYNHPSLYAACFANDYTYKNLSDPVDDVTGQIDSVSGGSAGSSAGTVWPFLATEIMRFTGRPVMFVPCPQGGTSITQWQPSVNHQDRNTLYGSMIYRAKQVVNDGKGTIRAVLYWQGETDAQNGMAQATYKAYMDTIANTIFSDLGVKLMPCKIQNCTGISSINQQNINNAIGQVWSGNANAIQGPDLSGINTSADGLHLVADAEVRPAAKLWATTLLASGLI